MWGLLAAGAALIGTIVQFATSLVDLKDQHPDELRTWNEEGRLMDQLSWLRTPIKKARYYWDLVRIRTDREHRVILKVQAVLWGWIFLAVASGFSVIDQASDLL